MTDDRRDINTGGGDYRENYNSGQYAEGDIHNNYQQTPTKLRDPSEAKLLAAVKNEVAGRLAQSLHNRVYIELHKEEDPSQVIQPWAVDVKLGSQPSQRCPEGTNIVDIFDKPEIGGKLLILGAPGSGKTMMLLQLAQELVQRAKKNASESVPVLLNLSAWKPEFKDIPSWMVADLKLKYGVRQDIAKKWIEEGRILPLLDGLDELMSERQETCVGALNEFLPAWSGVPLVVCSRREEYQNYEANLGLNGAVILQPLTDGQIEKFLRGAGCEWLWDAVRQDSDVMGEEGLARSPLLLTILVLTSGGLPEELWQKRESYEKLRKILFEAYITESLKRKYLKSKNLPATKYEKKPYKDDKKTKIWLGWLALSLNHEYRTEFFLKNLSRKNVLHYWHGVFIWLLIGLFYGLLVGLLLGLVYGLLSYGLFYGLLLGLVYGLLLGLIISFFDLGFRDHTPEVPSHHAWEQHRKDRQSKTGYFLQVFLLVLMLSVGLVFGGLAGGLVLIIIIIILGIINSEIGRIGPEIVLLMIRHYILVCTFFGLLISLISLHIYYFSFSKPLSLTISLAQELACELILYLILVGLSDVIGNYSLRITLWLFGYSPWNYNKFLHYCTDRGFLQRVGGGYRFVHALLRDHFAAQYTPK